MTEQRALFDRIAAAFLWTAAFCFAGGVFFSLTLLLKWLPPTSPVAIGLVTIERVSKLADYVAAVLFFVSVPPLTIWFRRIGARYAEKNRFDLPAVILFSTPFFLSPVLYLTTGKVGWILLLPAALAYLLPQALRFVREHAWIRRIFLDEDLRPYHALIFAEGLSWLLFRYIVTVRRIAHYPTLFLEIVFVALFLSIFWGAALLIARLTEVAFGQPHRETFKRIAVGALPLVALPIAAMFWVPVTRPFAAVAVVLLLSILLTTRRSLRIAPGTVRRLAAWLIIPGLIFVVSYASTAELSQWIDLFHRGEALGPASDYLRGKVPYRDVLPIHGMLEDGLLDSWLMRLYGRSLDVAIARTVVLGALLPVALWFLGLAVFNSIPLALLCVVMASWTTTENNRTFFQVAVVALFWVALKQRNRVAALLAGVVAGIALFFSYDIGLYSIAGAIVSAIAIAIVSRRAGWSGLAPGRACLWFVAGTLLGASPFAIYLATSGALDDFFVTSFVTIPSIIDAVWSLPFPDLVSTFRDDLNLNTLAQFVLQEKFHLILSPLTIVVAAVYLIQRYLRRSLTTLDHALLVLAIFAAITQRTAFGRAEFRHQYFAAFLIAPVIVLLALAAIRGLKTLWNGGQGTKAFVAVIAAITIPIAGVLFWVPDLVNIRIGDLVGYHWRLLKLARDGAAEEVAYRIADVSAEIQRLTRTNEPIFDFSNQPAFYFFADRPNPTRFYQVPILSPPAFQSETIAALEKSRTKVIVRTSPEDFDLFDGVSNDLRAQAVSAYIDDCFRFHRSIRGVELWRRVERPCAAAVSQYVSRIRLPARSELARGRRDRMVFPAVGSVPGIGGAMWVSDLTLHNPFSGSIPVRLRYVAGEIRVDRRVTLSPRQTVHWPDAVRSLFAAPQSVGALWIEHRAGQPPAATVKTHDATRPDSKSAVEAALTARNAATANTENAELTIVGIPGGTARRINAGVVNIGLIPATFRITARSRTGQSIGKAVESGVGEDGIWLVLDVERELGVKLDESTTLRMTAIAGTGAGFATAINQDGDQEFIAAIPTQQQR